MEANICDINHLDSDVLLPPRKRLLAGFKKRSSDGNGNGNGNDSENVAVHPAAVASSSSPCGPYSSEFNARLNNLLKSTTDNSNPSYEEIAELAESAAIAAVKAAKNARVAAEEKAAIATRAIASAKSALDSVASFNEEGASKERHLKKNKLKKHVPVQLLYKKNQSMEDSKTDEELARRLHRDMNSSPRISKNLTSSDLKGHKHKKLKISPTSEKIRVSNGGIVLGGNTVSSSSGHSAVGDVDFENEGTFSGVYTVNVDEKADQLRMGNGESGTSHSKEKALEEKSSPGRKRGRLKLKKLSLSNCTSRDRENTKEGMITRTPPLTGKNMSHPPACNTMPLFSLEPSSDSVMPIEATPWKCQDFKASERVEQNKVVQ